MTDADICMIVDAKAYATVLEREADLLSAAKAAVAQWDALYPLFPRDDRYEDAEFGAFFKLRNAIARATSNDDEQTGDDLSCRMEGVS